MLYCVLCIVEVKFIVSCYCYFGSLYIFWFIKEIINKIICRLLLVMVCLCLANIFWVIVCVNSIGVVEDEYYDFLNIFNSINNQLGQIVVLLEKFGWVGVLVICLFGMLVNYIYCSYVINFIVQEIIDNYKYM